MARSSSEAFFQHGHGVMLYVYSIRWMHSHQHSDHRMDLTKWWSGIHAHTHTHALTKLLITVKPKKHVEGEVIIMYSLIWWRYLSPPEKNPELLTSQEWYTAHMSPMTTLVAAQLLKELDLRKGTSTKMSLDTKLMKFSGQGFLFGMWGKFFWVMEGQHFLCGTKR